MKALYGMSMFGVVAAYGNLSVGNESNAVFFAVLSGLLYLSFKAEEWKQKNLLTLKL